VTHRPVIDLPAGPVIRASDGRQVAMAARFGGELAGGSVADGTYCVWLIDRGETRAVVWPPGYRARLDPVEILNPGGEVVARGGDMLVVGGGGVPVDPSRPCSLGQPSAFFIQVIA
jgi:hypothetical protein